MPRRPSCSHASTAAAKNVPALLHRRAGREHDRRLAGGQEVPRPPRGSSARPRSSKRGKLVRVTLGGQSGCGGPNQGGNRPMTHCGEWTQRSRKPRTGGRPSSARKALVCGADDRVDDEAEADPEQQPLEPARIPRPARSSATARAAHACCTAPRAAGGPWPAARRASPGRCAAPKPEHRRDDHRPPGHVALGDELVAGAASTAGCPTRR